MCTSKGSVCTHYHQEMCELFSKQDSQTGSNASEKSLLSQKCQGRYTQLDLFLCLDWTFSGSWPQAAPQEFPRVSQNSRLLGAPATGSQYRTEQAEPRQTLRQQKSETAPAASTACQAKEKSKGAQIFLCTQDAWGIPAIRSHGLPWDLSLSLQGSAKKPGNCIIDKSIKNKAEETLRKVKLPLPRNR